MSRGAGSPTLQTARAFFRAASAWPAAVVLLLLLALVVAGPEIWGATALKTSIMRSGEGPSADFLLGTDRLGRDLLARTIAASRLSLGLALAATAIAGALGVSLGIAIAFATPRLQAAGLRLIEVLLGFPGILLAIFVTAIIGPGIDGAVLAIGIAFSPEFARLASTLALSVGGRDCIAAARVLGVGRVRLLRRHVLPNIAETLTIAVFSTTGAALIAISSLSFLGLGVQPPRFDWGRMLVEGVESFYETPIAAMAPAAMIATTGLALGFFGEALARAMNPLLWSASDASDAAEAVGVTAAAPTDNFSTDGAPSLLDVEGLTVTFPGTHREVVAVQDINFRLAEREIVGIVGESGSGKSQTALAISRLVSHPGRVAARRLTLAGRDLLGADTRALDRFLGSRLALVFQDPTSSLNPALSIGTQVAEPATVHQHMRRDAALQRAGERMGEVHIPRPLERLSQYPHEFSGGMQQRVMIAMGLMNDPALIIADEPTTALDVTIQAQVIEVLREINQRHATAILLISHNIGVIAGICSRVLVMYAGRIVEDVSLPVLLAGPAHPYTRALMASVPDIADDRDRPLQTIAGQPPDPSHLPPGCAFAPRCEWVRARCRTDAPPLGTLAAGHRVACWVAHEPAA